MSTGNRQYIHGTDPEEQKRLALLNDLLNNASLKAVQLRAGEKVLDVGSGLGQLSRAMGRVLGPGGRVVAVERDPAQLADALERAERNGETDLVDFRQGDAVDLPLGDDEWGSFDVAHARFLLEHVPNPQAVVDAMVRALRPGGRIILEDDDHDVLRLWPEAPQVDRLWQAYYDTYSKLGNDPFIGRRLVELLHAAGAVPVRNDRLFFGSCAGSPEFDLYIDNFVGVMVSAREEIVSLTSLTAADIDDGIKEFREWARLPDAAMWYGAGWAEGRKPGEPTKPARKKTPPKRSTGPVQTTQLSSMQFLAESARDLNSSLKLEEVFRKIAERVTNVVDHHLFCVLSCLSLDLLAPLFSHYPGFRGILYLLASLGAVRFRFHPHCIGLFHQLPGSQVGLSEKLVQDPGSLGFRLFPALLGFGPYGLGLCQLIPGAG